MKRTLLALVTCMVVGCGSGDGIDAGSEALVGEAPTAAAAAAGHTTAPFVPQPPKEYDPRPRYLYSFADVDGNGHRDSLVFDRDSGKVTVRLYGSFPSGHPYAGVDQRACTASFWQYNLDPRAANVNVDYCNAAVRPEEEWARVPLADREHDAVRVLTGKFGGAPGDVPLLWDQGRLVFARTKVVPDTIGRRPGITNRFAFDPKTIDLSRVDICAIPDLHPNERSLCIPSRDRWRNLARPWDSVAIGDLNGDGIDDVFGLVAIDDDDPASLQGLWSLLSTKTSTGVDFSLHHLGNASANYRGAFTAIGDFDGSGLRQVLFVRQNDQLVSSVRFQCDRDPATGSCTRVVPQDSKLLANLGSAVGGTGAMTIDEIAAGPFIARSSSTLRLRIKRESEAKSAYYLLYQDTPTSPSLQVAPWHCPWQPSALDGALSSAACLHTSPFALPEIAAYTATRFVTPDECGGDCRAVIQRHLDDENVRNVILKGGVFPIAGTVRLSTLDANGKPTNRTKRLLGMNATVVGSSRYHRIETHADGSYDVIDVVPSSPEALAAELREHDKCREYRAYDDTIVYDPRASNRFVASRDRWIIDHCGVIETLGNDITVADLTIDTDALAKIAEKRQDVVYDAVSLGYFAKGWAMPYDMFGDPNSNAPYRILDTSRSVDERLQLRRLRFVHQPMGAIATYSTPHSVRDTLVEDIRCEAFPSTTGLVSSNCIELDAASVTNFPYDVSYREHIPFSPAPIENFVVRKGPDADSVCDMTGNDETVRVSGAIGFVVENCRVERGFGNAAFFLYVTDTGAKLDATLRHVRVDMDVAKVPPAYRYDPAPTPFFPRRYDAGGKELFQGQELTHEGMIQIIGRPISRSTPVNYRVDLVDQAQLAWNKAMNEMSIYDGLNYVYRATPSQVFIDGLTSVIASADANATDRMYRAHLKEGVGLTGKFICKDCDFKGGGQIMSADTWDLVGYGAFCLNDPSPGGDPSLLTPDQKACSGSAMKVLKSLAPSQTVVLGYDANGAPMTMLDPNQGWSRTHGPWFEFVNVTSADIYQPRAISVVPGSLDLNQGLAFRATPAEVASFSRLVRGASFE